MWAFPYEKYFIISKLKPDEVVRRLKSTIYIADGKKYDSNYDTYSIKYFEGYVNSEGFSMKPDITYRNTFLPDIKGSFEPYNDGTKINITMTTFFGYVGMVLLFLVLVTIGLILTLSATKFKLANLAPFGGFLFFYCLALFSFKHESRSSRNILLNIFEAD